MLFLTLEQKSMLEKNILFLSLFFILCQVHAQNMFVLSGTITDSETGEDLPGASVVVDGHTSRGTVTNNYGFYSLTLPPGDYKIRYQYIGFQAQTREVNVYRNLELDVQLNTQNYVLGNIVVIGEQADRNISSVDIGSVQLIPKNIESIPVIFGEADLLKTIQLTPGVKAAGEGNSGFHVRGGGIDQNLILLDEAPVYSASHLLGFFSVFNSEAIKNATLMKGFVPAEYGGRASSVLDIQMKEGNLKNRNVTANLGLISSSLTLEGPLVQDKSSFMISGRRTYADLFLKLSNDEDIRNSYLFFYDLNLKTNYKLNNRNRIYLSGYLGRDDFGYKNDFGFDWGSITGTFRWNHIFNNRLFSNTSLIFSNYSYDINIQTNQDMVIQSEIHDINIKQDLTWYTGSNNTVKFGANIVNHSILPGKITLNEGISTFIPPDNISRRKAIEWSGYISNEQRVTSKLRLLYGLRLAMFSNVGAGEFYEFDADGELVKTHYVGKGEFFKTQGGLEPRLAMNYLINDRSAVKASFNRMYQFLHLLSNTTTTTPTDLWLPSSNNVKPQLADQVSVGYFRNFKNNEYEVSLETYYKNLHNQIDYKDGADLVFNSTVEAELVFGRGWAYGTELLIRRKTGRLNGWIGYTVSKTMKQFDDINEGNPFPARHDRTHDVSVVAVYDLTQKLKLSSSFVFYTGNAVTFPSGRYEIDGQTIAYYTERNGYRMPPYHRLDVGLVWQRKKSEKFESSWNFSVYNAYARQNAYFIDFRTKEDDPSVTEAVQVSLFRAIPSVSYRFRF